MNPLLTAHPEKEFIDFASSFLQFNVMSLLLRRLGLQTWFTRMGTTHRPPH
jgi:hypothetical protein